jgi:hypothetical protein
VKKIYLLLALGIVVSLILSPGCKTSEESSGIDITGTWTQVNVHTPTGNDYTKTVTYSGTPTSGIVTVTPNNGTGTYTVNGSVIIFSVTWGTTGSTANYNGTIASTNSMNGNFTESGGSHGTWTSTR